MKREESPPPITCNSMHRPRRECKPRVSFCDMAEVLEVPLPQIEDKNAIDASELWWTSQDYKNNKRRCKAMSKWLMLSSPKDNDCDHRHAKYRGLERLLDDGHSRAQVSRAVHAVQMEQARHLLDGVVEDSDLILAQVYGSLCSASRMEAERLGRLDALEAVAAIESDWDSTVSRFPSFRSDSESLFSVDREPNVTNLHLENAADPSMRPSLGMKRDTQRPIVMYHSTNDCMDSVDELIARKPLETNCRFSTVNIENRRPHAWI